MIISKNASNKRCLELNFLQKLSGCISLSPAGVEQEALKIAIFEKLLCTGIGKKIHFKAECCKKYL